jgi:putative oxidoreductase
VFAGLGAIPFFVHNPPPQPGLAGEFNGIFYQSHRAQFVAFAQVLAGLLLLANRYVPVALIIVAEFLYNSYAFHITMLPIALAAPIVATILWLLVAFNIATSSPGLPREASRQYSLASQNLSRAAGAAWNVALFVDVEKVGPRRHVGSVGCDLFAEALEGLRRLALRLAG